MFLKERDCTLHIPALLLCPYKFPMVPTPRYWTPDYPQHGMSWGFESDLLLSWDWRRIPGGNCGTVSSRRDPGSIRIFGGCRIRHNSDERSNRAARTDPVSIETGPGIHRIDRRYKDLGGCHPAYRCRSLLDQRSNPELKLIEKHFNFNFKFALKENKINMQNYTLNVFRSRRSLVYETYYFE